VPGINQPHIPEGPPPGARGWWGHEGHGKVKFGARCPIMTPGVVMVRLQCLILGSSKILCFMTFAGDIVIIFFHLMFQCFMIFAGLQQKALSQLVAFTLKKSGQSCGPYPK